MSIKKVPDGSKTFPSDWKLSKVYRNFPVYGKFVKVSGNYPEFPETFLSMQKVFQSDRKLSRVTVNLLKCLETFQTDRKHSTVCEKQKVSRKFPKVSGKFPECLRTFQSV